MGLKKNPFLSLCAYIACPFLAPFWTTLQYIACPFTKKQLQNKDTDGETESQTWQQRKHL